MDIDCVGKERETDKTLLALWFTSAEHMAH